MAKPLYSHEEIIAAGEGLEQSAGGASIEAWEVFKKLGARGKFDRVREIWENHVASRSATPRGQEQDLPAEVDAEITRAHEAAGTAVRQQFIDYASSLIADHVRQMRLAQKQHAEDVGKLEAQLAFWRDKALASEEEDEEAETPKPPEKSRGHATRIRKPTTKPATAEKAGADDGQKPNSEGKDADPDQPSLL